MKRRSPAILLMLALGACSGPPPARLKMADLETEWEVVVFENQHRHPGHKDECPSMLVGKGVEVASKSTGSPAASKANFEAMVEQTAVTQAGRAYGGPGKLLFRLRRGDHVLLLAMPLPDGPEKTFATPVMECGLHYSDGKRINTLIEGSVRVKRLSGDRYEIELRGIFEAEEKQVLLLGTFEGTVQR